MRGLITIVGLITIGLTATAGEIPEHPDDLVYPSLSFQPPEADSLRFGLANGTPVYAKPDRQLPLVTLSVYFRGGKYLEPAGSEGLASIAGEVWRTGGAGERSARELDEELDLLAAHLTTTIGGVSGVISLDVLSSELETAAGLLMDVLTRPRFQEDRLTRAKDDMIQVMRTRNDSTASIMEREWQRLMYGDDYWLNRLPTQHSVAAITVGDCRGFVSSLVRAGNVVVAVSGDFEPAAMKAVLERTIGTLPPQLRPLPAVPQPTEPPQPGVYAIDKPDVNQGRVRMGDIGIRLGDGDEFPLRAVNRILGGGSFTSWIVQRVRSDEGLAYDAFSQMTFPAAIPGLFFAGFQSKSSTCAFAAEIVAEQIEKIRERPVSDEELAVSISYFVESFPRIFETSERVVARFALDDIEGRPADYWTSLRDRMRRLTPAELQRAARENLDPDRLVVLVVGNVDDIIEGHPDHEARLGDFGEIQRLPLRDPLTLAPIEN